MKRKKKRGKVEAAAKIVKRATEHGSNISAPRLFEDGEIVLFIQRLYGLSICFGQGSIERTLDLPSGYAKAQGSRIQYIIRGSRLFFHEGQCTKDKGTYTTWLGASKIVIVPRNEKTEAWLKESIRNWKDLVAGHQTRIKEMRLS